MELAVQGNEDKIVVRIIGGVIAESTADLRDALMGLTARAPKELEIDCSEMPFIESSGLGVLIAVRTQFRKNGTNLVLSHPQPRVMEIFRMTRMTMLFDIVE